MGSLMGYVERAGDTVRPLLITALRAAGRSAVAITRLLWLGLRETCRATVRALEVPQRQTPALTPEQIVEMESSLRDLHQRAGEV